MGNCIANCVYCGVSFNVHPHRLKQKNIFCCEKHAKLHRFENGSKRTKCKKCKKPLKMGEGWATPLKKRKDYLCNFCKNKTPKEQKINILLDLKKRLDAAISFLMNPEKCSVCGQKISFSRHRETPNRCPGSTCKENARLTRPEQAISKRMRCRMRATLKDGKGGRSWEKLVGYTKEDLKKHIEGLFLQGMSWDNMCDWHIDHIIPISAFNFKTTDDPDFRRCWALKNLRPLWAKDNLQKSDTLSSPMQPCLSFSGGMLH